MIEDLLADLEDREGERKYYGVVVGRVINPLDPLTLGRVQVQLPFIDSLDLSPWARVAVPLAGMLHGFYFIPNVGDEVLVAFEHGDVNAPYIVGCLWNALAPPPLPSPVPQISAIRTLTGNQIVFTEAPGTVTIQNAPTPPAVLPAPPTPGSPYQSIVLNPAGVMVAATNVQVIATASIQIMVGANVVTIGPDGVNIASSGKLSLTAAGAITMTAGGTCSITAPLVKIN